MSSLTVPQAFALAAEHHRAGRVAEAETWYRRILAAQPAHVPVWQHLGNLLADAGRLEESIAAYRSALELEPDNVEAHSNLGITLAAKGSYDEAVICCRRAAELRPDLAETHDNLGNALRNSGQLAEAEAEYRRALHIRPDFAHAHNNLGSALRARGDFDAAAAAYRRALAGKSAYPEAWNNLANVLREQGDLDGAIAAHRTAVELHPGAATLHSNLLMTALYHPAVDERSLQEGLRDWDRRYAATHGKSRLPHRNSADPGRRLKVGYVSGDFCAHVVGRNVMSLFEHHDREQFEVICYSTVLKPDDMTEQFRRRADGWRDAASMGDEALAARIREDQIDILVDLALHSAGHRLLTFARQPAPVQLSFAAYPGSTGMEAIGHRISDRYLERMNESIREKVFFLDSFWGYEPSPKDVLVNVLPAVDTRYVTFGSLNAFCKINEPILRLWAKVLGQVRDSHLVLLGGGGSHCQRVVKILGANGIEMERVEFRPRCIQREYMELYHGVDITLDPFPYNGHTSSLDSLWMGVPVVSLVGERTVSRGGLSQLSNLGLPELAAFSEDDYVRIAVELASDLPRLTELRATLRRRMEESTLTDTVAFTRRIEMAFRVMWQRWCAECRV